jgi:hypothetical protein
MTKTYVMKIKVKDYLERNDIDPSRENAKGFIQTDCPACDGKKKVHILVSPDKYSDELPYGFSKCQKGCFIGGFEKFVSIVEGIEPEEAWKKIFTVKNSKSKKKSPYTLSTDNEQKVRKKREIPPVLPIEIPHLATKLTNDSPSFQHKLARAFLVGKRGVNSSDLDKLEIYVIPYDAKSTQKMIANKHNIELASLLDFYKKTKTELNHLKIFSAGDITVKNSKDVDQYFKVDGISLAIRDLYNHYLHLNRAIMTIKYKRKIVGFVSRAVTDKFIGPKVLNSSGPLQSYYFWNYHNLVKSGVEELVLCEGILDAYHCGIDRSMAILGLSLGTEERTLLISKLLKPKKVIVYFDPGAEDKALVYAENLSKEGLNVEITFLDHLCHWDLDREKQFKDFLEITGSISKKSKKDTNNLKEIPYDDYMRLKCILSFFKKANDHDLSTAKSKILKIPQYKEIFPEIEESSKKLYLHFKRNLSDVVDFISPICDLSYIDAGDLSKEENTKITNNSSALGNLVDLKIKKLKKRRIKFGERK